MKKKNGIRIACDLWVVSVNILKVMSNNICWTSYAYFIPIHMLQYNEWWLKQRPKSCKVFNLFPTHRNDFAPFGPNTFNQFGCSYYMEQRRGFFSSILKSSFWLHEWSKCKECRHEFSEHDSNVGSCHRMLCITCYYCLSTFNAQRIMNIESFVNDLHTKNCF